MNPEWIAVGLSLTGMVGSLVAALWALRERKRAGEAADRSESRAEESLDALQSMDGSLQRIAMNFAARSLPSMQTSSAPGVDFLVEHRGKGTFVLRNVGVDAATNVSVSVPQRVITRDLPDGVDLQVGQGHQFLVIATMQSPSAVDVTVSCNELEHPIFVPLPA